MKGLKLRFQIVWSCVMNWCLFISSQIKTLSDCIFISISQVEKSGVYNCMKLSFQRDVKAKGCLTRLKTNFLSVPLTFLPFTIKNLPTTFTYPSPKVSQLHPLKISFRSLAKNGKSNFFSPIFCPRKFQTNFLWRCTLSREPVNEFPSILWKWKMSFSI
jgi:hypothetical protein